jgi:hypothetical protein
MAAKKSAKKTVTIELDPKTLIALLDALELLGEILATRVTTSDDPALRKVAKRRAKKSKKSR